MGQAQKNPRLITIAVAVHYPVIDPSTSMSRIAKTNTRTPASRNPSPIMYSIGLRSSNVIRRSPQILGFRHGTTI